MLEKIEQKLKVKKEQIGTFNLILIGAVIFIALFSIGQLIQEKIIQEGFLNGLQKYSNQENIFVDANSKSEKITGTPDQPFIKISQALEKIQQHPEIKNIYINPGKYQEILEIPKNINIFAHQPETYLKNNSLDGKTLKLKGNNTIQGLIIQGGKYGIYIEKEAESIKIENCKVFQTTSYGIYNEEQAEISEKHLTEINNSNISENYGHGLYLQQGNFNLNSNKIYQNGVNGIDLHQNMTVSIFNNEIYDNVKNGLEADLGNLNLTLENSTLRNNGVNGINLQSRTNNSTLKINNNLFENNRTAGINCIKKSIIKSGYFSNSFENDILKNNQFQNTNIRVGPNCLK
jgi:hypothetical protein